MNITRDIFEQVTGAYRTMAAHLYRPMAPSDGFGNIVPDESELDLEAEATEYALRWWEQEDDCGTYVLGFPNYRERVALVYLIEAAKSISAANTDWSLMLARVAVEELERIMADPDWKPSPFGPRCEEVEAA